MMSSDISTSSDSRKLVAVIGAGIAGIVAAQQLARSCDVTVLEKSRGFGGRMAARREDPWQFDHGAQYFTARSPAFHQLMMQCEDQEVVSQWNAKILTLHPGKKPFSRVWFEPHYVASPSQAALVKHLASGLEVKLNTRVAEMRRTDSRWSLGDDNGNDLGSFHTVVTAMPAPQCLDLLPKEYSGREELEAVKFSPCFALMLGYRHALELNFDGAIVRDSPIAWVRKNTSTKQGSEMTSLLLHSCNHWTESNLEHDTTDIQSEMLSALEDLLGEQVSAPDHIGLHKWRYARVESALSSGAVIDHELGLAACGDWCLGNRVEDAFLSGVHTATLLG